jgi:hypothetical protein
MSKTKNLRKRKYKSRRGGAGLNMTRPLGTRIPNGIPPKKSFKNSFFNKISNYTNRAKKIASSAKKSLSNRINPSNRISASIIQKSKNPIKGVSLSLNNGPYFNKNNSRGVLYKRVLIRKNESAVKFIAQLKKCDLHVHMGGACTKEFFLKHFEIMSELCKDDENGGKLKNFIDTYCIKYLRELEFKNTYKDLDDFRGDFDKYSDMLKILCGVDKPSFIYTKNDKLSQLGFNPRDYLNDLDSHVYGSLDFLSLILDNFQEEQKKHNCVAMEISQTPFPSVREDNGTKYSKYFSVVEKWRSIENGNLPLAFISTCVRDLHDRINSPLNKDVFESTSNDVVKAIGVASTEKPPSGSTQKYLCPEEALSQDPWGMRAWLEKTYRTQIKKQSTEIQSMVEQIKESYKPIAEVNLNNENNSGINTNNSPSASEKVNQVKLIPHVGEEYYGDDGSECLESVNSYLHFNDPKVIKSLQKNNVELFLKLERIAHGCQCARSEKILDKLKKQQVTCELCLTSNDNILSTKVTTDIFEEPPIITMLNKKVPVILCSDDPAIFTQGNEGCILNSEYLKLYKMLLEHGKNHSEALMCLKDIANRSIDKSLALTDTDKKKYIANNDSLEVS